MRNKHSRVCDPATFKSCAGDLFQPVYSPSFAPDGTISLKETDRIDIKKEINSHLPYTDMSFIISRLLAGDDSVLSSKAPMYGDFTQFPRSYAEMLELVQRGEDAFNALPLDVRMKFDNDRYKWFASIGSDSWFDAMGISVDVSRETSPAVDVVPDIKEVDVVES